MERATSFEHYLLDNNLEPRTLLIANITPDLYFERPSLFYNNLEKLIVYKKCRTSTKLDYIQNDLCEFKPYVNFCSYIDRIDQRNCIVVNWMPAC